METLSIALGVLIGCFFALSWFAGTDAPYVPTKGSKVRQGLNLAGLKKGETFYELGSGDGRVVFAAAKMGAKSYGIEQSILRVLYSKFIARKKGLKNAHFIHGNIFKKDLSSANVVFIYLLPKGVQKLHPKLKKELKKGSRVITQDYHFKEWKPIKKEGNFWLYKQV